ncbi:hypothetical protein EDC04DRAFT_1257708 [Pisolithus marmoratus]|nr:hypothetical protein EDC04DRAFT_1257708 [Pisolithus marmoratus]
MLCRARPLFVNSRMFAQLLLTAVSLPVVAALSLVTPGGAVSGQPLTLVWTSILGDPSAFALLMVDEATYPLASDVNTALLSTTVTLPVVQDTTLPYTIQAVNPRDFSVVYAQTGQFYISAS